MAKALALASLDDEKPLYQRQENEPTLWWNRFKRYRGLGSKRSLQAAFEQEQGEIKALESTKKAASSAKVRKNTGKYGQKSLKPVPLRPQVPGSWKQASIKWHWVERSQAYDIHLIDDFVTQHMNEVMDGLSLGIYRIGALKQMFESLQKIYNANYKEMPIEQIWQHMTRMQSILKDIRDEMSHYDEALTRVAITKTLGEAYSKAAPEDLRTGIIKK